MDNELIDPADIRCQACGTMDSVQEHHFVERAQFGKRRLSEREAATNKGYLCARCHMDVHAKRLVPVVNGRLGVVFFVRRWYFEIIKKLTGANDG